MTPDWSFQPSEEILKTKLKNFDSIEVNTDPVYQETAANTESVASNILTLEWQMYRSYEKLLRAYILRILPKFSSTRTKTGAITDPVELESAEQKLFSLVQSDSFPNETKNLLNLVHCASLQISKISPPSSVQTAFSVLKVEKSIWKLPTSTSNTLSCLIADTLQYVYF